MNTVDWGQAWQIVGGGIAAVFFIMVILSLVTHFMGKIFIRYEARKKAAAEAAAALTAQSQEGEAAK